MNRNSANKVILVGHLGNQPEIRFTTNDIMSATLNLATNSMWRDDEGDFQERTDWHRVVVWRNLADYAKNLKKGQMLYIEGHLQSREWTDKENNKHFITEVIADALTTLGPRKKEESNEKSDEPEDQS
ncbi:MAG: single-stranded DNA-binding protein [Candidatus Marinimicrobia bacterium]|nr:single-stranded DNA-binding protein [Candidatus Neomarinimicrobiota bacterium]MDD5582763.1 single-stranded DNA-binding protein [Candidatus Neomarinimicrobiota bacterium]